jgi:hypothetical protein
MRILITEIERKATTQPEGYLAEVLASGQLEGLYLSLSPGEYSRLRIKYNNQEVHKPLQMPPGPVQIQNAANALVRNVKSVLQGNRLKAPDDIIKSREETCGKCEFWAKDRRKCSICGCYTRVKITLAAESCPKGYWESIC